YAAYLALHSFPTRRSSDLFYVALDEASVTDISRYQVKRWNYMRTEKYGSGHFRMDGSPGDENMPVLQAFLSDDKKTVFLAVPNRSEEHTSELQSRENLVCR